MIHTFAHRQRRNETRIKKEGEREKEMTKNEARETEAKEKRDEDIRQVQPANNDKE